MRESDEVRIRTLLYRLRYLRGAERWALASRLAEAVECGVLGQADAYRVLMREIPLYAYFACRNSVETRVGTESDERPFRQRRRNRDRPRR
jgi:hypothetical protein